MRSRCGAGIAFTATPRTLRMFATRKEAGRLLSGLLASRGYARPVVLALSPGGAPVGYEIARALGSSLELLSVAARHADAPVRCWSPELAARAFDPALEPGGARVAPLDGSAEAASEGRCSCLRRERGSPLEVAGHTVILVDDWIERGGPVVSVLVGLRRRTPRRIVLATPVVANDACRWLERELDELFCLSRPARAARADCHAMLEPLTDAFVIEPLDRAALREREPSSGPG